MTLINVYHLSKTYTTGKIENEVLKHVSFSIKQGEFVSIIGPSGSGKTTLLHVLGGFETYQTGKIELFGKELSVYKPSQLAELRSKDIGFVFQFFNLIPNLTVYENVLLASILGKNASKNEIKSVLKDVDMLDYINYYPTQISGGMQQRVAIARCLINQPKIIFADEPTGNLDYKNGLAIMELFKKLNQTKNITVLMVTHNLDMVKYGSRTLHMLDGRVVKDE